jgi:predicted heme/steroid binding protein/quinol monooxygenase YgiN
MVSVAKEKFSKDKTVEDKAVVRKILSSVVYEKGFHFFTDIGKKTGEPAINLSGFYEELKVVELQSIRFHFQRKDFQNWIRDILGDLELAQRIDQINMDLMDQDFRNELLKIVLTRLTELQTAYFDLNKKDSAEAGAKTMDFNLKKFTLEELKQYNGHAGKPAYVMFEGKVYDVTDSNLWHNGDHMDVHQAGKDLTEAIKIAPHNKEVFDRIKKVGQLA